MLRRAGARSTLAILGTNLCAASTVLLLVTQGVQRRVASSGSRLIASHRPDPDSPNEHQARPVSPGSNLATSQVLQVALCASVATLVRDPACLVRVAQSPRRAPTCSQDPSCTAALSVAVSVTSILGRGEFVAVLAVCVLRGVVCASYSICSAAIEGSKSAYTTAHTKGRSLEGSGMGRIHRCVRRVCGYAAVGWCPPTAGSLPAGTGPPFRRLHVFPSSRAEVHRQALSSQSWIISGRRKAWQTLRYHAASDRDH
jgi:hypothetical protein